jgi:hypothetical protein
MTQRDIPPVIRVHCEYCTCTPARCDLRIRLYLDLLQFKCDRLAHTSGTTSLPLAMGYPVARSLVTWNGACGKRMEESCKGGDVLSWGERTLQVEAISLLFDEMSSFFLRDPIYRRDDLANVS